MADFDGNGTFEQIDSVTIAGTAVSDFTHTPAHGTYTVTPVLPVPLLSTSPMAGHLWSRTS